MGKQPLIILDRDGVLNPMCYDPEHGLVDSPLHVSQAAVFDWTAESLKQLNDLGYLLSIATNQPSAAKGKTTLDNLKSTHEKILSLCQSQGARLLSSHICFHRSEDQCNCRKPKTGLLEDALMQDLNIDVGRSWMVGDGINDIAAGKKLGLKTAFLGPKKLEIRKTLIEKDCQPDFWGEDLREFVTYLKSGSEKQPSPFYQISRIPGISDLSLHVRKKVYELFLREFQDAESIADLGVTSDDQAREANFLEKLYPHTSRITAIGVEDARHLEKNFPGLKFVRVQPGEKLPFQDGEFDVVFSHAVIEHIKTGSALEFFLGEALRIGKSAFITTPNKFFPIEPHTMIPLLHFAAPSIFNRLLPYLSSSYRKENLHLFSKTELMMLLGKFKNIRFSIHEISLLGFTSNFVAVIRKTD